MPARRALLTGITGQDGWYLTRLLQAHGYQIHGLVRPGDRVDPSSLGGPTYEADIQDSDAVRQVVLAAEPDECYHLAAQTYVTGEEFSTVRTNVTGTLHVLDALRRVRPDCRLFLAGSSEMFGKVDSCPQDENTPFRPRNVYGASKTAAYYLMSVYREQHGLFACCGFLYNHESPRRPADFVTRKITQAAARIRLGLETEVTLGNLEAIRDWGHAGDYVRAMWLMLQQPDPDDYVLATGHGRTVREFLQTAFGIAGLDWQKYVKTTPELFRPQEPVPLVGCSRKAEQQLDWRPEIGFVKMVTEMVNHDLSSIRNSADT